MRLLLQKHVLAPKIFFFFLPSEKAPLTRGDDKKKSPIEVSSLFGHLKMSKNLEESVKMPQKIWNSAKCDYCPPRNSERTNVSSPYELLRGSPIPHY